MRSHQFIVFMLLFLCQPGFSNSGSPLVDFNQELPIKVQAGTLQIIKNLLKNKLSMEEIFTNTEYQVLTEDLGILYQLQGSKISSPLFKEIFLTDQFDGTLLTQWIVQKFKMIAPTRGHICGSTTETDYIACFTPGTQKIRLSPLFFKQGRLGRLATLIHEARHSQGFPHLTQDNASEDGVIDGARGAEWIFLSKLSSNCTNCFLMDRLSAYKQALDLSQKIKGLDFMSQQRYDQELKLLKNPLEEKFNPLIKQLKKNLQVVHAMPSLCIGNTPFNEVTDTSLSLPLRDCILIYYFVDADENSASSGSLNRHYKLVEDFLLLFNPIRPSSGTY